MVSDKANKPPVSPKDEKKSASHKDGTAHRGTKSPAEKTNPKSSQAAGQPSSEKTSPGRHPAPAKPVVAKDSAAKDAKDSATKNAKDSAAKDAKDSATKNAKDSATKDAKDSATKDAKDSATKDAKDSDPGIEPEREPLLLPREVDVDQDPNAAAPAPGRAPRGDARSFRRADEFCFIYRHHQFLIRRQGKLGKMGQWNMIEYPSQGGAAHAYAEACSELSGEGFVDFRG